VIMSDIDLTRRGKDHSAAITKGLGWFSVALGLAELVAPRGLAALIGVAPRAGIMRLMGLRELTAGVGIFDQRKPVGALWSRIAGDGVDLSLLSAALASRRSAKSRVAAAIATVVAVTILDIYAGTQTSRRLGQSYLGKDWRVVE
jgi:hypothetical protein